MKTKLAALVAIMSVLCATFAGAQGNTNESTFTGEFLTNNNQKLFEQHVKAATLESIRGMATATTKGSSDYAELGKLYLAINGATFTSPSSEAVRHLSPFSEGGSARAMEILQNGSFILGSTPLMQYLNGNIQTTFKMTGNEIDRGWYTLNVEQKRRVAEFNRYQPKSKALKFDGDNGESLYELSLSGEFGFAKGTFGTNLIFIINEAPLRTLSPNEQKVHEVIASHMETFGTAIGGVEFEDPVGAFVTLLTHYTNTGGNADDVYLISKDYDLQSGWGLFSADNLRAGKTTETVVLNDDFTTQSLQGRKKADGTPGVENFLTPCVTFDSWGHENRRLPRFERNGKIVFGHIKNRNGDEIALTIDGVLHKMVLPETDKGDVLITSTTP